MVRLVMVGNAKPRVWLSFMISLRVSDEHPPTLRDERLRLQSSQ